MIFYERSDKLLTDQELVCFNEDMADLLWWQKVERRFEDFEPRLNWAKVSQLTGIIPNRFSLWKKGQGLPDLHQIQRIADAIQVPVEYLTREDGEPVAPPPIQSVEERLLLDASRKVGVPKILEVIFTAAVARHEAPQPPQGTEVVLEPARSVLLPHPGARAPRARRLRSSDDPDCRDPPGRDLAPPPAVVVRQGREVVAGAEEGRNLQDGCRRDTPEVPPHHRGTFKGLGARHRAGGTGGGLRHRDLGSDREQGPGVSLGLDSPTLSRYCTVDHRILTQSSI